MLPAGALPQGFSAGPVLGGRPGRTLVLSAIDPQGAPCVLKFLDPRAAPDALAAARFDAEQAHHHRAAACPHVLSLHPGVPPGWLGLSWAHGGSLDRVLERGTGLTTARLLSLVRMVLTACAGVHATGIVHRDVKPSNLLLDGDELLLADFGVSAARDDDGRWRSLPAPWRETEVGTPGWVAPELQADPTQITPANDLYGVGRVWSALERCVLPGQRRPGRVLREALSAERPADRPSALEALALLPG